LETGNAKIKGNGGGGAPNIPGGPGSPLKKQAMTRNIPSEMKRKKNKNVADSGDNRSRQGDNRGPRGSLRLIIYKDTGGGRPGKKVCLGRKTMDSFFLRKRREGSWEALNPVEMGRMN